MGRRWPREYRTVGFALANIAPNATGLVFLYGPGNVGSSSGRGNSSENSTRATITGTTKGMATFTFLAQLVS